MFVKKKVERQRKRERRIILQKNRAKLKKTKGKGEEMLMKVLKKMRASREFLNVGIFHKKRSNWIKS
jgi:hypothetical protein